MSGGASDARKVRELSQGSAVSYKTKQKLQLFCSPMNFFLQIKILKITSHRAVNFS